MSPITFEYVPNTPVLACELKKWLAEKDFTHFVTLAFNREETTISARKKLERFHADLDRQLLGARWHRKPKEERTFFFAFPEHINSNFHYHLLLKVRPDLSDRLTENTEFIWNKIVNQGTVNVQPIQTNGCISYSLKEMYNSQNYNAFVISTEFLRS